jgi:hypothetical protein
MADENVKNEVQPGEGEVNIPAPTAELTVQDLTAIKQIIDVASSRGAFKPNEMAVVGQTYNKLEAFLGAVNASQSEQPKEEPKGE